MADKSMPESAAATTAASALPFWRQIPPYDPKANPDPLETLYDKLYQLDALLEASYDITGSGAGLEGLDAEARNNYLWACAQMAHDCVILIEHHKEKADNEQIRTRRHQ